MERKVTSWSCVIGHRPVSQSQRRQHRRPLWKRNDRMGDWQPPACADCPPLPRPHHTPRLRGGLQTRPASQKHGVWRYSRDSTASPERSPLENENGSLTFEINWAILFHLFRAEATRNLSLVKFFTQIREEHN